MAIEDYRGVDALMAYGPLDLDSLRWAVIAKIDQNEAMAPLAAYTRRALAVGGALALLASVVAMFMAAALTRPIAALVGAARRVSKGTLDVQVDVAPDDEYRELGEAFNEMVRKPPRQPRGSRPPGARKTSGCCRACCRRRPPLKSGAARPKRLSRSPTSPSRTSISIGLDVLSRELGEDRAMALLSDVVGALDEAAEQQGVEKVRTIGASYLAASGLSLERPDHTARMVEFAREAVRIVRRFNAERQTSLRADDPHQRRPGDRRADRAAQVHLRPLGRHGPADAAHRVRRTGPPSWSPGRSTSACASWCRSDRRRRWTFRGSARSSLFAVLDEGVA